MGISIKKIVKWLGIATLVFVSCCVLLLAAAGGGENKSNSQELLDSSPTPELVSTVKPTSAPKPTNKPRPTVDDDMCSNYTVVAWSQDAGEVMQLVSTGLKTSGEGDLATGYVYVLTAQKKYNQMDIPTCDSLIAQSHAKIGKLIDMALSMYTAISNKEFDKVTTISENFVLLNRDLMTELTNIKNKYQ